jgi:hypothetical protein
MSIKTYESKYNLINNRIKYGTDGRIIVDTKLLVTDNSNNRVGINTRTPQATLDVSGSLIIDTSNIINSSGARINTSTDTQVLSQINNNYLWGYQQNYFNVTDLFPINTINTLSPVLPFGSRPFAGACLAPNGKIYCMPNASSNTYCIINTINDSVTTKTSMLSANSNSSVCAPNGKIYSPTTGGTGRIRVLDTTNNDSEYLLNCEFRGYVGTVLASNGKIYCVPSDFPYNSAKVMVIRTSDDNISYIDVSGILWPGGGQPGDLSGGIGNANGDDVWYGGALSLDGRIFCPPSRGTSILVINTNNDTAECDISGLTFSASPVPGPGSQTGRYNGAVLAPNGRIYCLPWVATSNVIEIDTSTNTYVTTSMTVSGGRKCIGGTLAPDGRIYCSTDNAGLLAVINTNRTPYTISTISSARMNGSCLGPNGKVYFLPNLSGGGLCVIRSIDTGIPILEPWMMSPEFNKF